MGALLALRTTVLNPTIWLLVALTASALAAVLRRGSARDALARVVGPVMRLSVLVALSVAVLGGLGARAVLGYLAPGSYAEEVLAARSFLSDRQLYRDDERRDYSKWLADEPPPVAAWTLPGMTVCQASALEWRPQFYTAQGHSPALLMASVPIVALAGGHVLYVGFLLLSLAALGGMALALVGETGLAKASTGTLALFLALAGWQPALASIRQGDAVIIVAGLVVGTWRLLRNGHDVGGGVMAGLSGALFPPALVLMVPVGLKSPRALMAATATLALVGGATVAAAGPMIFSDYLTSTLASARLYAESPMTYSSIGRLLPLDSGHATPAVWATFVVVAVTIVAAVRVGRRRDGHGTSLPGPGAFDVSVALFAVVMFLLVPVAWSQHVMLLVLPAWALLSRVLSVNRPAGLAILAGLFLLVSLPDPAVVWTSVGLSLVVGPVVAAALPSVPVWAVVGLWFWLLLLAIHPGRAAEPARAAGALRSVP